MHLDFKENAQAAMERMDAWWDHEILDRPVISYTYPRIDIPFKIGQMDNWCLARQPDAIEDCINRHEQALAGMVHGGECFPRYHPNYGPGILAAVLGCEPEFKSNTVWFHHPMPDDEIEDALESARVDASNPWFKRLIHVTKRSVERAAGKFQVAVTDLGGVLDTLSVFLTHEGLLKTMRRNPALIDRCRCIIVEKWMKAYEILQGIIERGNGGCSSWLNVWSRKRWYPLQCDVAFGISPKMFKRFVLPDLVTQAEALDHAIYHLDGVGQLPFVDDLISEPAISGIQWVPGAGKEPPGSPSWDSLYRKIQAAGKNIVLGVSPENLSRMYQALEPEGLHVSCHFAGKIWAEFYLPRFIGGMGGEEDE